MEYGYSLVKHIEIFNMDPISSIDLNEELLLFGTMLGYCGYYVIQTKKLKIISELEDEHIISTQIIKKKLYYLVGDEKIIVVEGKDDNYNNVQIKQIKNYYNNAEHNKKCDNTFCMIKNVFLFSIELSIPGDNDKSVDIRLCPWKIKNIEKNTDFEDRLEISNFWVPFDFDGINLIYIDFYEKMKKSLKIFNCKEKKFILDLKLCELNKKEEESLGHISHIKKLKKDEIFLVHNYKKCQIRDFTFKLIKKFEHLGKEIIACDSYYNQKDELKILLLDLECNVFVYHEKADYEEYLFNLNKISSIPKKIKDQKFFAMGYPYFIKMSENYIAITTDQGCFLLKRE